MSVVLDTLSEFGCAPGERGKHISPHLLKNLDDLLGSHF